MECAIKLLLLDSRDDNKVFPDCMEDGKEREKLFLCGADVLLEEDDSITPVIVDCMTYVREKLQSNKTYFYHPFFGNPKITKWPEKVDIACLHCCETFDTVPVPVVRHYDELKNIYYVYGIFCLVNCAKSYLIEHETSLSMMRLMYFNHMCRNVFNIHGPIRPAYPRIRLKRFGGDKTIDEFRQNANKITSKIIEPPFIQSSLLCEDISPQSPDTSVDTKENSCEIITRLSTPIGQAAVDSAASALSSTQTGLYSHFLAEKKVNAAFEVPEPKQKNKRAKVKSSPKVKKGGLDAFLTFK